MRITDQLIDAMTRHHLFSKRFGRNLKNNLNSQNEITIKALMAEQVKLTMNETSPISEKGEKEPRISL